MGNCFQWSMAVALTVLLVPGAWAAPTVLGIRDTRFTLNDQPTFLLGISYYGAPGGSEEFIRADLDDMQRLGFNWLRVWATWAHSGADVSAVDIQGQPRQPFMDRLKWLVAECDRRGLIVDVTITRGKGAGSVPDIAAHRTAVEALVNALREHRNWYLDLANERDVGDARFVSVEELRDLRELVRALDPQRLVTASFGGHDLNETHVRDGLISAGLDFLSPHRPRHAGSPEETAEKAREVLAAMRAVGRMGPLHYQEPFRRGYGTWQPAAEEFLIDLRGAISGGAAGWCLHNGSRRGTDDGEPRRSFDLGHRRLFDQLDEEERKVTQRARFAVNGLPRLRVSENKRFLVKEDGTPFFWLGDTAWSLFQRPTREEVDLYLETRAAQGFTVVQAVVLGNICGTSAQNPQGAYPLKNNDPAQPNEAFFTNVDYVVNKAEALGLYIGMLPTWGDHVCPLKGAEARRIFTPQNAAIYGEFLGRRYRNKPIIWVLGGDHNPTAAEVITWRAMAKGLSRGDGGAHLMTYHPRGWSSSSAFVHAEPWLDFHMIQSGHARRDAENYSMIAADYAKEPVRPCLDGEPCYEDHPVNWVPENGYFDDYDVRKAAYRALFAGAFGHTYGANPVWQFYEPDRRPITGARTFWREGLQLPGANQMKHARALLESRPFLRRVPDQSLLVSPLSTGADHPQATRDADGGYAFVYLPSGKPVTVDLEKLAGQRVRAWWYNPRTGAAEAAGESDRHGAREFAPPDSSHGPDWVLVLDDAGKEFPPPGSRH